ncbi:MAG: hypothetical protein ACP5J8_02440 [Minisyncoccia bacterium]
MFNSAKYNEIMYNDIRSHFPLDKIGSTPYLNFNYVKKILSAPYNLAVLVYQKVRVFVSKPTIKFRTKRKFF